MGFSGLTVDAWHVQATYLAAASVFGVVGLSANAGLVAHYRFEDGMNVEALTAALDTGPNNLDGSILGSLSFSDDVQPGNVAAGSGSLNTTGDFNYVSVPHDAAMVVQGDLTVEMLVKPNATNGGSPNGIVTMAHKRNLNGSGSFLSAWNLSYNSQTGQPSAYLGFGSNQGAVITSDTDIRDGEWHHVALVLDRDYAGGSEDRFRLYLDGQIEVESIGSYPNLFYNTTPLEIGAGNFGSPIGTGSFRRNFNGLIDEVLVVDEARTTETFTVIPTPATGVMMGLGLLGVLRRRK